MIFELVEIGVWWTIAVCFFHPIRPKYREIKMKKKKKKKKKKANKQNKQQTKTNTKLFN